MIKKGREGENKIWKTAQKRKNEGSGIRVIKLRVDGPGKSSEVGIKVHADLWKGVCK
ncbi:MAG: hypothetical protein KKD18_03315 [Nanoarchaeota archaeon]|nr:hypothetical protein [Nanoarchaeota archaeon]MBU0977419.1 hypothetical protein [Nanoarchaeota archaeon]